MKNYILFYSKKRRLSMRNVKHNKLRNTGLLFEFLLRQITSDVLNKTENSNAVNIVKKKFNENTELGKELALYNIIINKRFSNDKNKSILSEENIIDDETSE